MFEVPRRISNAFAQGLKEEITRQGLIDTGTLRDSIDVSVTISDSGVMIVDVYAVDYLKYLWDEYSLYKFVNGRLFVFQAYSLWVSAMVKKNPMLNWEIPNSKIIFNLPE